MRLSRVVLFRGDEAAANGRANAIHLFCKNLAPDQRASAIDYIDQTISEHGPIVAGYPSWHPLVLDPKKDHSNGCDPETDPQGFSGLDHTIYFRDAFLTAPYGGAEKIIKEAQNRTGDCIMEAEQITDVVLYASNATPVLVWCKDIPKESDGSISKRFAMGRMLSAELPAWKQAQCGETWEDMRRFILGPPCGSRSSLFVNQETGQALREVWALLNKHELFGPVRTR